MSSKRKLDATPVGESHTKVFVKQRMPTDSSSVTSTSRNFMESKTDVNEVPRNRIQLKTISSRIVVLQMVALKQWYSHWFAGSLTIYRMYNQKGLQTKSDANCMSSKFVPAVRNLAKQLWTWVSWFCQLITRQHEAVECRYRFGILRIHIATAC